MPRARIGHSFDADPQTGASTVAAEDPLLTQITLDPEQARAFAQRANGSAIPATSTPVSVQVETGKQDDDRVFLYLGIGLLFAGGLAWYAMRK